MVVCDGYSYGRNIVKYLKIVVILVVGFLVIGLFFVLVDILDVYMSIFKDLMFLVDSVKLMDEILWNMSGGDVGL